MIKRLGSRFDFCARNTFLRIHPWGNTILASLPLLAFLSLHFSRSFKIDKPSTDLNRSQIIHYFLGYIHRTLESRPSIFGCAKGITIPNDFANPEQHYRTVYKLVLFADDRMCLFRNHLLAHGSWQDSSTKISSIFGVCLSRLSWSSFLEEGYEGRSSIQLCPTGPPPRTLCLSDLPFQHWHRHHTRLILH